MTHLEKVNSNFRLAGYARAEMPKKIMHSRRPIVQNILKLVVNFVNYFARERILKKVYGTLRFYNFIIKLHIQILTKQKNFKNVVG